MLGFMNTQTEVGLYSAAVKLKTVLVTAVTSLGHSIAPTSVLLYCKQNGSPI